ncbi:TPA: SsrA-binding protein [Patescibacteria group bacterium]|nr:SsrA-binding protein [Patescibacteria group bacterium]HCU47497.1 SsrA-binding protein [Patescibacteria group bacterium]
MNVIAENRKALFNFKIQEKFEAGLVLTGPEVKSVKKGSVNLQGSYVMPRGRELWITGCHIAPYGPAKGAQKNYDPKRDRKLLLTHKELSYLLGKSSAKGLTIVPMAVYTTHRLVKVQIAVAVGKNRQDKRVSIKQREVARDIRRSLKY